MRRIFHRCVPEWDLSNQYIFSGLDLYDVQDMCDLQELCMHDLEDL